MLLRGEEGRGALGSDQCSVAVWGVQVQEALSWARRKQVAPVLTPTCVWSGKRGQISTVECGPPLEMHSEVLRGRQFPMRNSAQDVRQLF